ncbi:uncharacterized protein TRIADDRAFT_24056 [Trichoplax adhaerens]|uniref:TM2 domain-containing protein n=1 Tax=Trichoplax adhaerens TaxID=10228 RepID=B3RW76_TRIAD|nr:hypothetical protein TRIADDRAFT_24056 [Trichoplax adhaerens]EDV26129.1 hypothetical protein TRIADDRAFT_24056 [Trichoplax adhaerens]|eukprot:XP_002112162.1 hypothetical protein TRIADDRAFT_24056 [Trichoplax adhaerens]
MQCSQLPAICLQCDMTYNCFYGEELTVNCSSLPGINCKGDDNFIRSMKCAFCYQFPSSNYTCSSNFSCRAVGNKSTSTYIATCTIDNSILCLGNRTFQKNVKCNWTSGHHWSTAVILSITLGGFGADRFYLGYWRTGLGKLFSLGGLGVWTLIDVVLIAIGYLKPEDGSLYL